MIADRVAYRQARHQGCTHDPWPRSRRIDCITWNAVLSVKTSAAASTPVYFSITGAAAVRAISSRPPLNAAHAFSPYLTKMGVRSTLSIAFLQLWAISAMYC